MLWGCGHGMTPEVQLQQRSRVGSCLGSCGAGTGAGSAAPSSPDPVAGKGKVAWTGLVEFPLPFTRTQLLFAFTCVGFGINLYTRHESDYAYNICFSSLSVKIQLIAQHRWCLNCLCKLFLYSRERYKNFCKTMCPEACLVFQTCQLG